MTEAASSNEQITISYLTKGAAHTWEHTILNQSTFFLEKALEEYHFLGVRPLPDYKFKGLASNQSCQYLNDFYGIEKRFERDQGSLAHLKRKRVLFNGVAKEIERQDKFELLAEMLGVIRDKTTSVPYIVRRICDLGVSAAYLLSCEPNRFLVGTKGGAVFKEVNIPILEEEPWQAPIFRISESYTKALHLIGKRESIVVPRYPLHPNLYEEVQVP